MPNTDQCLEDLSWITIQPNPRSPGQPGGSTQWDIIISSADCFKPAYKKIIELAAQGEIFHNDDTTIKIQSLVKEKSPERTGMYTTGIVPIANGRKTVLFLSGRKHAGENLNKVLADRDTVMQTPLQMCDALSRNTPQRIRYHSCSLPRARTSSLC